MNNDRHVLLGPDVIADLTRALDTLAIVASSYPTFGHHPEWNTLGNICMAMSNDKYPMPQVHHTTQSEVDMFNDEIHVKAQAEARYYLATKRKEMLRREALIGVFFGLNLTSVPVLGAYPNRTPTSYHRPI